MHYIIAGATGFIGSHIVHNWLKAGHKITAIGRDAEKIKQKFADKVSCLSWSDLTNAAHHIIFKNADLVLNLTGANIGEQRWTQKRRNEILSSRINTTRQLANICASLGKQSPPLFTASAIGVYGLQQELSKGLPPACDENTFIDFYQAPDFLAKVARQWELASASAEAAGVRVLHLRFAAVLDKTGGALPKMALPFKFGLGGKVGSGQQPFCWISLTDLIKAIEFLIPQSKVAGVINLVAPNTITQKQFAQALSHMLHRPCFMPMPRSIIKLLFGQMGEELLLKGQHVVPSRLLQMGFDFDYPTIETALKAIYSYANDN